MITSLFNYTLRPHTAKGIKSLFWLLACMGTAATGFADTHYVATNGSFQNAPYTFGSAPTIQAAIDAADPGDIVLVSDGTYENVSQVSGVGIEATMNRVVINKAITVRSVNGSGSTTIRGVRPSGNSAVRGVWMASGAILEGFTVTNGATRLDFGGTSSNQDYNGGGIYAASTSAIINDCVIASNTALGTGGGVYRGTLNNCVIRNNSASNFGGGAGDSILNDCTVRNNSANNGGGTRGGTLNRCSITANTANLFGGGTFIGTLNHCVVSGNTATNNRGGGSYYSTLNNSTLTGNHASDGGGSSDCTLNNCIVYFNTSVSGGGVDNYFNSTFFNSCSPGLAASNGNITNDPLFAAANDYQLQSGSPCRDNGDNAKAPAGTDLAGNTRIVHDYVDMGAYEYQSGTTQGDYDLDGAGNGDEGVAGTNFNDSLSVFEILEFEIASTNFIRFSSVSNRQYVVETTDDLAADPSTWATYAGGISGTGSPITVALDAPDVSNPQLFYRVRVTP